jgi:hypothetical protein
VPEPQVGELAFLGVGGKRGEPVAVDVGESRDGDFVAMTS